LKTVIIRAFQPCQYNKVTEIEFSGFSILVKHNILKEVGMGKGDKRKTLKMKRKKRQRKKKEREKRKMKEKFEARKNTQST